MPRQSVAAKSILRVVGKPKPIEPRPQAPPEVQDLFREIVRQSSAEHFRQTDALLLEEYCQSLLIAREAYNELQRQGTVIEGKCSPWLTALEKAHRSSAVLAARLRLSPRCRTDPKTVARHRLSPDSKRPWE